MFDDSLEDLIGGAAAAITSGVKPAVVPPASYVRPDYTEPCRKCGGSGVFRGFSGRSFGACFACKGKGKKTFKTAPATRAKAAVARVAASERKAAETADAAAEYRAANADIAAWLDNAGTFEFALSLRDSLAKYGSLTENQAAAARRCIAKRAEKAAERVASAPVVEVSALEKAFATATANGLKRIKMRVAGFAVTPAKATSKNPGALYVKAGSEYLGKISGGRFFAVAACDDATKAKVVAVVSDPLNAAKAYGIETGSCSCCGRELTDPVSIANGIGPICAANFGWG